MSRISIPDKDDAPADSEPVLDTVMKRYGFVPNLYRLMALSPSVLKGFVGLQGALRHTLDAKTRTGIALAVSEVNRCDYCVASHSFNAENFARLSPSEVALNRKAESENPKRAAALRFAAKVIQKRGKLANEDFEPVKAAGYTDAEILEIIALAVQFTFTNLLNNVISTEVDFPEVDEPIRFPT
jgi:uncharacterized peroxidase-related enzyme